MRLPIPKGLERRLAPLMERGNSFLREFEWTWTKAVLFGMGFWFFLLTAASGLPSFWLYFSTKLGWNRSFWLDKLKDFIAVNLVMGPAVTAIIIVYLLQKQRRKVRGESGDVRPSGGYR